MYNTMAIHVCTPPKPTGRSPSLSLKNFKSQRVDLETPWVSTRIWWVSNFRVCFALGFLRVSAWPPWVSTGILAFGFACLRLCYGFPQVCVHIPLASCLSFHRFPFDFVLDLLYGSVRFASQHAFCLFLIYCIARCGFPTGFLWVSCRLPASFP